MTKEKAVYAAAICRLAALRVRAFQCGRAQLTAPVSSMMRLNSSLRQARFRDQRLSSTMSLFNTLKVQSWGYRGGGIICVGLPSENWPVSYQLPPGGAKQSDRFGNCRLLCITKMIGMLLAFVLYVGRSHLDLLHPASGFLDVADRRSSMKFHTRAISL